MIGRKYRFHGRGAIVRLYSHGKSVRSGPLSLRYKANEKRDVYRLAVIVSRKVSKSAVTRNRIRRRIYENVRILSTDFNSVYDLTITAFDEKIATMAADTLTSELKYLCEKAKLVSAPTEPHAIVNPKE